MKRFRFFSIFMLLALLLAACGGAGNQTQVATDGAGMDQTAEVPVTGETAVLETEAPMQVTDGTDAMPTVETATEAATEPAEMTEAPAAGGDLSGDLDVLGFSMGDEIATVRVETFQEMYPDVQVNMAEGALDPQQFLTSVASGSPPDLIYAARDDLSTYATRGAIIPLDQCISDQGIDMSQFRQAAVDQVTVEGQVYGIPEFFNVIVVIVNNQALADAGMSLEDLDISDWDSIAAFNDAATVVDGGTLTRIGFDPKLPEFLPLWAKANGADLISADGRTAQLDDPAVVEALEFTVGLHEAAGGREDFMGFRDTWDFFGGNNQMAANQLGAFPMEQWYLNVLSDNSPDVDISVIPFEDRQGNPITFATGNTWAIPQGAENVDAACAFMAAMTDPATWEAAARARADARAADGKAFTGTYTGNTAADDIVFNDVRQPSGNAVFDDAVDTVLSVQDAAFSIPANPAGAEFRQAWVDAVNRALNGEQTPAEALAQAQQEAQEALDDAWNE